MELIPSFIENKAPEVDEAWAWDRAIARIQKPSATTVTRTNEFKQFMQNYVFPQTRDSASIIRFEPCTWEEVKLEAGKVIAEYNGKGNSWKNPFRSAGRISGNAISTLEFLFELLPQGEYSSILCGALKLVYSAARKMKEVRESILKAFDGLSQNIDDTRDYLKLYREGDLEVQERAEELYVAILESVQDMTNWLNHNPIKESFKAFFQHSSYGRPLQEKITTNIQEKTTAFKDRIQICLHTRILNIDNHVVNLNDNSQRSFSILFDCLGTIARDWVLEQQENHNTTMMQQHLELEKEVLRLKNSTPTPNNNNREITYPMPSPPVVSTVIIPQYLIAVYIPLPRQSIITSQSLLQLLQNNPQDPHRPISIHYTLAHDAVLAVTYGSALSPRRQSRTASILQNPYFQHWFQAPYSNTLIINGMEFDVDHNSSVSPLTYLCVLLSQTISTQNMALPLTFFCAQHATPGDALEGASGLLRSLCGKLLLFAGESIDLSFISDFNMLQAISAQDITRLCYLLESLVQAMISNSKQSPLVVFFIIDSISYFETQARIGAMDIVMPFLQSMVEVTGNGDKGVVFKLLVTAEGCSDYWWKWFPRECELKVDEQLEVQDNSLVVRLLGDLET
ncbi:hypothetical protein N431DRAFT_472312 [Stipitochalara longipes BDJ]|nr:hypothetical protein N431DRAFT_472312 [Stipitochalara longipes BDJ]